VPVKAVEDVKDGSMEEGKLVEEDVEDGGKPVEEEVEDGGKPVEDDVEDGGPGKPDEDKDTALAAVRPREVVPRCAAFPRAADDLQISCSSLK
jgi:hypothetical protein